MSENKFETISALVDNYQTVSSAQGNESLNGFITDQTIDEMLQDEELLSTWQRYHLIGDVIRDETPEKLQVNIADEIANVIAQEPAIVAPQAKSTGEIKVTGTNGTANVFSFMDRAKNKISAVAKPLGQVAIAASAAGLMILGVQPNAINNDEHVVMPSEIVQTMPVTGFANPVSFNYESPEQKAKRQLLKQTEMKQKIAQQRRFQALLLDHNQQIKFASIINKKAQPQTEKLEKSPK
jgi:sigma-E factor negative regulatory protein RseA